MELGRLFDFDLFIFVLIPLNTSQYDTEDDDVVHTQLINGKLPYLDPRYKERSYAEKKLVELMEKCWLYDPDERISIFDAVEFLRQAVKDNAVKSGLVR